MLQPSNKIMTYMQTSISQRIKDKYQDDLQKLYNYEILYEVDAIVIDLKLERAVLDKASEFRDMMNTILNLNYKNYILDLSEARFMDSTFLGSVVIILKKIKALGGNLSLILDYNRIKILAPFEQLKNILQIYNSTEEAISEIQKKTNS